MATLASRLVGEVTAARADGLTSLVLFDIDSTLFDTGERHRRILVEWACRTGDADLRALALRATPESFHWSVDEPLRAAGVDDRALLDDLMAYWSRCFFADAYGDLDLPRPGAADTVRAVVEAGALAIYFTARPVSTMGACTRRLLTRWGFPLEEPGAALVMKPDGAHDAAFKRDALDRIEPLGRVVATLENEPGHANGFLARWPDALHLLVGDVHSPQAPEADPRLVRVPGFL